RAMNQAGHCWYAGSGAESSRHHSRSSSPRLRSDGARDEPLHLGHLLRGERPGDRGARVRAYLLGRGGPWDDRGHGRKGREPGERELVERVAVLLREPAETLDEGEVLVVGEARAPLRRRARQARPFGRRRVLAVLAREKATGEREERRIRDSP